MVVREQEGEFVGRVEERAVEDLPGGDVLVRVHYSSLNYKDALSATGHRGVTRRYPHTPGIDAAGVVEESTADEFQPGDEVIVTSYDLGMNTPGGWGQYIRIPGVWVVPLPAGLSLRESMIYGTAGFTAGLAVLRLERAGLAPDQGEVLVTGASGGVGSMAVGILARAGYRAIAATGKAGAEGYLRVLGAVEVVARETLLDETNRPLLKTRWAGAVDAVGGEYLASVLKAIHYGGFVASCGLVASPDLPTSVYPFILRGVSLIGIDSQNWPMDDRREVWRRLAEDWKIEGLDRLATGVNLDELNPEIERILAGQQQGRVVVRL
ncbi:MAG: YhdH/YhfP family quinone oxidoreductase [Anaerolineae bacterium]|nr:YhdH/YhfP family quinone oxidoreductase [Anaerolineae bacterium]